MTDYNDQNDKPVKATVPTDQPGDTNVVAPTGAADDSAEYVANSQPASDAAQAQREEDDNFRNENPNVPLVRAANPEVGGESF